jgi:hypothetical protein
MRLMPAARTRSTRTARAAVTTGGPGYTFSSTGSEKNGYFSKSLRSFAIFTGDRRIRILDGPKSFKLASTFFTSVFVDWHN